jgi:hypothetical protein
MRSRHRWIVGFVIFFVLAVPREGAAWWNWIHELSGPGPFNGIFLACRSRLKKDFSLCDHELIIGTGLVKQEPDEPDWHLRLEYGLRTGTRNVPGEHSRVIWNAGEALVEHRWNDEQDRVRFYSGGGGTLNLFSGRGFEAFGKLGLRAILLGAKVDLGHRLGMDVGLDYRYLNVTPADFGMPRGSFSGGNEFLVGVYAGATWKVGSS